MKRRWRSSRKDSHGGPDLRVLVGVSQKKEWGGREHKITFLRTTDLRF